METFKTYHHLNGVNLLTGPDDDIPRKVECLEFVMHAPSDYYRSNCPCPSGEPAPLPPGFIWTRLQMPPKKRKHFEWEAMDSLSRFTLWWVDPQPVEGLLKLFFIQDWYRIIYFWESLESPWKLTVNLFFLAVASRLFYFLSSSQTTVSMLLFLKSGTLLIPPHLLSFLGTRLSFIMTVIQLYILLSINLFPYESSYKFVVKWLLLVYFIIIEHFLFSCCCK